MLYEEYAANGRNIIPSPYNESWETMPLLICVSAAAGIMVHQAWQGGGSHCCRMCLDLGEKRVCHLVVKEVQIPDFFYCLLH